MIPKNIVMPDMIRHPENHGYRPSRPCRSVFAVSRSPGQRVRGNIMSEAISGIVPRTIRSAHSGNAPYI